MSTAPPSMLCNNPFLKKGWLSLILLSPFIVPVHLVGQSGGIKGQVSWANNGKPVQGAEVGIPATTNFSRTNEYGRYTIPNLEPGQYKVKVFVFGYQTSEKQVKVDSAFETVDFRIDTLSKELEGITIEGQENFSFGVRNLRDVEGTGIYSGRKSKVLDKASLQGNLAMDKGRQVFNKVAGLNIWESDGAGLQLDVGSRGLNPKRTSNFNTRQNGYDIAADALGYPETYYTPPTQALEQIEIIRGASSLQYGPQFGGMINFKLKEPPQNKVFELNTAQTLSGYALLEDAGAGPVSSYTSISGTSENKNWSYLGYYKFKQNGFPSGDGWRPNSQFKLHNGFASTSYHVNQDLTFSLELTKMYYQAQQPGGLTDRAFQEDHTQSIRDRNWFQVDWNMASLKMDYKITDQLKLNVRNFGLLGNRYSIGYLERIDRSDPGTERNLLKDNYRNFGNETRFLYNYQLGKQQNALLLGARYYNGTTDRQQGFGSEGSDADFSFVNPPDRDRSDFTFPSRNIAVFAENKFSLTPSLNITPGFRYEHIQTRSDGQYQLVNTDGAGNIIFQDTIEESRSRTRSFVLFGLGISYKPSPYFQVYGNFSQNYRAISFNDMRIINPNLEVDNQLQDEQGYTGDIGIRGQLGELLTYDVSIFGISYQDKIGAILKEDSVSLQAFRYRTNIADALHYGVESFAEVDLLKLIGNRNTENQLSLYGNFSWLSATYINSQEPGIEGNAVEYAPPLKLRSGINYKNGNFTGSFQYSYVSKHYADATNAEQTINAIHGSIPSYSIMDLSASYTFDFLTLKAGVNNLADAKYFTRRATGYPGPGIIPGKIRSAYITLKAQL